MAEIFLRLAEVKKLIGFKSDSAIWFKLNPNYPGRYDPTFPKPVRIGKHAVAWPKSELESWMAAKMNERTGDQENDTHT